MSGPRFSAARLIASLAATAVATGVPLVTFDGAAGTTHRFVELNDPVMGGRSSGTWHVDEAGGFGVFDGEVVNVPSLSAPGFVKAAAVGRFADASSASGGSVVLSVRTSTPDYTGFRFSFASGSLSTAFSCAGGGSLPFSRGCFKARFRVPAGAEFAEVRIPLSAFSDKWSPSTGDQTTTCADDKDVCPTAAKLAAISRVEVWAEGVNGKAHLEVKSISIEPSSRAAALALGARPPPQYDECSAPVQPALRYNISTFTQPEVRVPVDANESLASAVCCDVRTKLFAEPQFLYDAPNVALFKKLRADSVTTFYDSVCGLPLFRAPVGRSMADFEADTTEHGWPSFRAGEVVMHNVITNRGSGDVRSACGTHLGSFLPDAKGDRWCMDLSCIAGNPVANPTPQPTELSLEKAAMSLFSRFHTH